MRIFCLLLCLCAAFSCTRAEASWYWPFGSDSSETGEEAPKRVSELMEPAALLIDTASDLAATGAVQEAISTYRKALSELAKIEEENGERAKTAEFSTLRNKRAYVEAAITSLQFEETRRHAKSVSVSDTRDLEKKLAQERADTPAAQRERARKRTLELLAAGRVSDADRLSKALYARNTNDVMTLNLRAAVLAAGGKCTEACPLLDRAIELAPEDYVAYYNMARLLMQMSPDNKEAARGYFSDGCALGGPKNAKLEALLK